MATCQGRAMPGTNAYRPNSVSAARGTACRRRGAKTRDRQVIAAFEVAGQVKDGHEHRDGGECAASTYAPQRGERGLEPRVERHLDDHGECREAQQALDTEIEHAAVRHIALKELDHVGLPMTSDRDKLRRPEVGANAVPQAAGPARAFMLPRLASWQPSGATWPHLSTPPADLPEAHRGPEWESFFPGVEGVYPVSPSVAGSRS